MRLFPALVMMIVVAVPACAQPKWQVVTAKDGSFSVEMPATPSINRTRTRNSADGATKMTIIGAKTGAGLYLMIKLESPTPLIRGTEERHLDLARDILAEEFNGKVLTEKKVMAANRPGRDFTIRGTPAEETGVLTMRVRTYLDGKSIYAVMVGSQPDRELPVDAGRFLGSLILGDSRVRPTAAQESDPKGHRVERVGPGHRPGQ
jgi:hypothetical protein